MKKMKKNNVLLLIIFFSIRTNQSSQNPREMCANLSMSVRKWPL